jgi:predicted NAD/FAD-dependent oxidoreductase
MANNASLGFQGYTLALYSEDRSMSGRLAVEQLEVGTDHGASRGWHHDLI